MMLPPRVSPAPRAVQLKFNVDIQLDRAFHEQQWSTAANLARQRHKSTKDDYYKAVEVAARSHGDNTVDCTTGREVVQALVNDGTIIKDVDALDLYELAIEGTSIDYARTIGVLRTRLTKALPKDQNAGLRCLEACMWNSDWENAQEIAVSLNKNFPTDRKFLFQNIATTFLVATMDSTNEIKKKLFPNLAKAQVDRAFNLRPSTGREQTLPSIADFTENEIKLWIKIREMFGSAEENLKMLSMPNWGPLFFLEHGFTDAFLQSMHLLNINHQWDEITKIVNTIFDKAVALESEEVTTPETCGGKTQESVNTTTSNRDTSSEHTVREHYINASREWFIWTTAVNATNNLANGRDALEALRRKIENVVRVLVDAKRMNPVFQQNYDRILLDIAFARSEPGGNGKLHHLLEHAKKRIKDASCFATLKGYLELLTTEEVDGFVSAWEVDCTENTQGLAIFDKLLLIALRLRVRFFQATSLSACEECRACHSIVNDGPDCTVCLKDITERALDAFCLGVQDTNVSQEAAEATEDPLSNLAILGSICLIKLSGAGRREWQHTKESYLYHTDTRLFLQAVVWLDYYLRKTAKNDSLRLLLVKLYLSLGCVTRALHIWSLFDVKNTLLECLGTMCLDRLASIAPSYFITGHGSRNFVQPFIRHFETALRKRYPDTVLKALQNSSHAELLNAIELARNQSRNCISVLAVVENRRGMRLKMGRTEAAIEDEPLINSLLPSYELQDFTDYNPLPGWAGPRSVPIQELVAYGPLPTNRRCHLSVSAERFFDLVCHMQAKDFKPTKTAQMLQLDWQAVALSCKSLQRDMNALLYEEFHDANDLTTPETWYFAITADLARLVELVLEALPPAPPTKGAKEGILAVVRRLLVTLSYQVQGFLIPDSPHEHMQTLHGAAALHVMGMLRDSTLVIKSTAQYINMVIDRVKSIEKARGTAEAGWLAPETKKLAAAAAAADAQMKDRVKALAEDLQASGWVDRLEAWAFGDDDATGEPADTFYASVARKLRVSIPSAAREVWAIDVADSWRDVIRDWGTVKFD